MRGVLIFYTTALFLFFTRRRELKRGQKIYTGFLAIHIIIAILAFIGEKIFFIVVMLPLWYFILPAEKLVANTDFIIRQQPTIMGPVSYILYENHTLYEQPIGRFVGDEMFTKVVKLNIAEKSASVLKLRLTMQNGTDSLVEFAYIK